MLKTNLSIRLPTVAIANGGNNNHVRLVTHVKITTLVLRALLQAMVTVAADMMTVYRLAAVLAMVKPGSDGIKVRLVPGTTESVEVKLAQVVIEVPGRNTAALSPRSRRSPSSQSL